MCEKKNIFVVATYFYKLHTHYNQIIIYVVDTESKFTTLVYSATINTYTSHLVFVPGPSMDTTRLSHGRASFA